MTDTPTPTPSWAGNLPEWAQWTGPGPTPKKWTATNPDTQATVIVYRSYEDYCDD